MEEAEDELADVPSEDQRHFEEEEDYGMVDEVHEVDEVYDEEEQMEEELNHDPSRLNTRDFSEPRLTPDKDMLFNGADMTLRPVKANDMSFTVHSED